MHDKTGRIIEPGEGIAIEAGCVCTVRDGELRDNRQWPEWLVQGCPIHDPELMRGEPERTRLT